MSYWKDKVAVVTGGSSGLGRAIAAELARRQARVVISGRTAQTLDEAARHIDPTGERVTGIAADVTRADQVEALVARAVSLHGRLDLMINNAGRSARGGVLETTPEDFQELWELNFIGVVNGTRAAMPHLAASGGHLVNIGSLASKTAARYLGAYTATKHAVAGYTHQLRLELASLGVHVLLVCPGPLARVGEEDRWVGKIAGLPPSAAQPGGGVRLTPIDPKWLAEKILRYCEKRRLELVVPWRSKLLFALAELWPAAADWITQRLA
jgi:NAD(P)-dependent dehydrogenase (short-subunit alcohol dehydrogenase family)